MRLNLNTPENARKTLSRLMRARGKNTIDRDTFRDLVYAFEKLLNCWRFEKDLDIERRLDALEEQAQKEKL